MLVDMSGNDLNIICVHYNNLITAQYDEIARIEAMPPDNAESPLGVLGGLFESRDKLLADAHKEMAFFRAELAKFSELVAQAKKSEGAGGVWS
jgi:hypothetical protein